MRRLVRSPGQRLVTLAGLLVLAVAPPGGWADGPPRYALGHHQIIAGWGPGRSAAFVQPVGVVGRSGAGGMASPQFVLTLEPDAGLAPPGGQGRSITVRGAVDDDTAAVVVRALTQVRATVAVGRWTAAGVRVAEGPTTLTVTATDPFDNATTRTIRVTVDTIPPARPTLAAVVTPTAAAVQTLSGTRESGTGLWVNGAPVVPIAAEATWTHDLPLAQGRNPVELWAVDRAGNASTHVAAMIVHDATPPATPVVRDDGTFTTSLTQLHATWSAQEDATVITRYAYGIGTAVGQTDVAPWTAVGTTTEATRTGLTLVEGRRYWVAVQATNAVGLISPVGSSDGIRVNTQPPAITAVTPADGSRSYPPGEMVCTVTATDPSGDPLEYRFLLDGRVLREWSPTARYAVPLTAIPAGVRTWRLEVRDPNDGEDARTIQWYRYHAPPGARE